MCARNLHENFKKNHHLKHWGRLQYGLFLKGIGISLEDALAFWRTEFSKVCACVVVFLLALSSCVCASLGFSRSSLFFATLASRSRTPSHAGAASSPRYVCVCVCVCPCVRACVCVCRYDCISVRVHVPFSPLLSRCRFWRYARMAPSTESLLR